MRGRRWLHSAVAGGAVAGSLSAGVFSGCTLLQERFEPEVVEAGMAEPAGGAPESAIGPLSPGGGPLCSGPDCTEAGGPALSGLAEPGAACGDAGSNADGAGMDCGRDCSVPCASGAECTEDLDCASLRCDTGRCAEATCTDGIANQNEPDQDCGGPCAPCIEGARCTLSSDCVEGLFCPSAAQTCTEFSCQDQELNGSEIQTDCGGGVCPGCPVGAPCSGGLDCASRICDGSGACTAASCSDGELNQDETGVDCGGDCPEGCATQSPCADGQDCQSGVCSSAGCGAASATCCQAASCDDGVLNGNAPGVSGETDVDCGGAATGCARCPDGDGCRVAGDCASGGCASGVCAPVSCDDDARNGNESDVDCGGNTVCERCAPGQLCLADEDCGTGVCEDGRCCGGSLGDCTRCAERLSVSIECTTPAPGIDPTGFGNCADLLICLAEHPQACPTRNTAGCGGNDPLAVCSDTFFGGVGGTGVIRAQQVLSSAGCQP